LDSTVRAWWESYLRDFSCSSDVWYRRYLRDFSVDAWYADYLRDLLAPCREIDDWYAQYRHDVMPKVFRGSPVGRAEVVGERHCDVLFSELRLVGRGSVTSPKCGDFLGFFGCAQIAKHSDGCVRMVVVPNSCDKMSCPRCFMYGWCVRIAKAVDARLEATSVKLGLPIEHIVCSLPECDYGLTFKEAKRKCIGILGSRGVIAGHGIPHGNRIDDATKVERFSPHFHILGFIEPSFAYDRCRKCERKWNCLSGCGGFDDNAWALQQKDEYLVKVLGARKSVTGTLWY